MERRELLGVLGTTAAGLWIASGRSAHAAEAGPADMDHEGCLKACQDCGKECNETFHHCCTELAAGKREHAKALHMVADCAEFCELSAAMVARKSPFMVYACAACADACKACASECEKFDSAQMKDCVKSCRTCEASCRAMVKAMSHHRT